MTEDNVIRPTAFRAVPDDRQQQQQARQLARLREIESAPGKRGVCLMRLSDRIEAARAVGRLVRRARDLHMTMAELKNALPGSARHDRYMLRSGSAPDAEHAASSKLLQQVRGYLAVATTVARLTGQDEDALKIEVLINTSRWSRISSGAEDDDPRTTRIAIELAEMGKAVARRTRLAALLKRASCLPGRWDLVTETFAANASHSDPGKSVPATLPCLRV